MVAFKDLMKISQKHTALQSEAVKEAKRKRQLSDALRQSKWAKSQEEQRKAERARLVKHFEDEKRKREHEERQAKEKMAAELELRRREDEQRDALRYGPKKAAKLASSVSAHHHALSSSSIRDKVSPDLEDIDPSANGLTREELRQRKEQAEIRKLFSTKKRTMQSASYSKAGKRLPGGAVDIASPGSVSASTGGSVKDRLAAMPNTLVKLNTVKRDTRTIDEILQDRAKLKEAKVLDGEDARNFNEWFTSTKKKSTPASVAASGGDAHSSQESTASPSPVPAKKLSVTNSTASMKPPPAKSSGKASQDLQRLSSRAPVPANRQPRTSIPPARIPKTSTSYPNRVGIHASITDSSIRKRPRSPSDSASPPPKRIKDPALEGDIRSDIWKLFGRDRGAYVGRDVISDDEDMEADARILEREEKLSSRFARREEAQAQALEIERRRQRQEGKLRQALENSCRG